MNKQILHLAIPNIISNISVPLLGIVDMALMGHMDSDAYIGAIALGALIFNFIYWSLGFLRMGTSGFTAQAFGREDQQEAILVFSRALFIAISISLVMVVLQRPIEWLSFLLLEGETDVESLAMDYFRIRIWAAPATLGQFALLGFFLGMQNARFPMYVLVTANVINIIFNAIFVLVLDMGSNGVALGTVIAQYSGLLLASCLLVKKYRYLFPYWNRKLMLQWDRLKAFLMVNKDIFIRTMSLVLVFTFFTATSASADAEDQGADTILAVNSLLMQFFMFFSFLIDGFAHAAEALSGRFIGAKSRRNLNRSIRILFAWGTGIAVSFTFIYLLAGELILGLLTDNHEVIRNAAPFFPWVVLVPLASFVAFIWDGIFIGATAGRQMRNAMLISTLLVFFPSYYLLNPLIGNHGLWLAFILYMLSRGVTMTFMRKKALQIATTKSISTSPATT